MSTVDWNEGANPGADIYSWESQWTSIEVDAADDPDAALSQYADLVERVLEGCGYAIHDVVARQGEEREAIATYLSARETAERAELGEASRGDVTAAKRGPARDLRQPDRARLVVVATPCSSTGDAEAWPRRSFSISYGRSPSPPRRSPARP